jgi:hypothetical protein
MSYLCITNTGGVLSGVEVSAPSDCSASSYIAAPSSQFADLPTLMDIFTVPVVDDLQTMWMLGFGTPVICYLTAWAFQSVIGWFEQHSYR